MIPVRALSAWLAAAAIAAGPVAAEAQALDGGYTRASAYAAYTSASAAPVRGGSVSLAGGGSQTLALPRGKSAIVELPAEARDVLVTDPQVADVVLRTPRRIYVMGLANGMTDAVFFDAAGHRILSLNIHVDLDAGALNETLARLLPGSHIHAESINNSVVLSGEVPTASSADQAVRLATSYAGGDSKNVVNMLTIAGKDQVMLKVRIIEVQRNVIKQLGFDMNALIGQVGSAQFTVANAASFAVNGGLLGGVTGGYKLDTTQQPELQIPCSDPSLSNCFKVIKNATDASNYNTATAHQTVGSNGLNQANSTIKAFERVGLVRTLAEPNLTAISGESAKFLAGGEYPVPTGQDNNGRVSIEFKPYGVGLSFVPVVLSEGRISLRISTEVSELSTDGAFTLTQGTASTLTVPALKVRRAETTVELPSGGSMMIAGLLQDSTKQTIDSLPGLTNLPVLGALFRSRDYLKGETEMMVLVTPYIVRATDASKLQTPADGLKIANDAETVLLGRLNHTAKIKPAAVAGRTYQGPYGYVIE